MFSTRLFLWPFHPSLCVALFRAVARELSEVNETSEAGEFFFFGQSDPTTPASFTVAAAEEEPLRTILFTDVTTAFTSYYHRVTLVMVDIMHIYKITVS